MSPRLQEVLILTPTLATKTSLGAGDRCDRCGSRAYVRVVMPGGGELLFCSHHWTRHADALRPQALEVQDETDQLFAGPAQADA